MLNNKKYDELKKEAIEAVIEMLEDYDNYYCDLHHYTFNMDYKYIYYADAVADLNEYGVFDAIGEIVEYEKFNFGEVNTDFTNPCDVGNMLWYIIGEEVISELGEFMNEVWNEVATDEVNQELIKQFKELL